MSTQDTEVLEGATLDAEEVEEMTLHGDVVFKAIPEIPEGVITFYNGENPPAGWQICDGSGETPNLVGKYVHTTSGSEDPGTTGGTTDPSSNGHSHPVSVTNTNNLDEYSDFDDGSIGYGLSDVSGYTSTEYLKMTAEHPHCSVVPVMAVNGSSVVVPNIMLGFAGDTPPNANWADSSYTDGILRCSTSPDTTVRGASSLKFDHGEDTYIYGSKDGDVARDYDDNESIYTGYCSSDSGKYDDSVSASNTPADISLYFAVAEAEEVEFQNGIAFWNGSLSSLPTGWALCDGANGTPDLARGRMVRASSTTGQTSGSNSQSVASHSHSPEANTDGDHGFDSLEMVTGLSVNNADDAWSDIRRPYHKLAPIQLI